MKTLARLLAVTLISAFCVAVGPAAAQAAPVCDSWTNNYTYYSLLTQLYEPPTANRKVIGVDRAATADKTRLILANYDQYAPNQRWVSRNCNLAGNIYLQYKNEKSQKCMDKSQDRPNANGNLVYLYPCSGANNQLWQRRTQGGSNGQWQQQRNLSAARCLDVVNRLYVNGSYLHMWDCATNLQPNFAQQWNTY
jgi:hypothetical protein